MAETPREAEEQAMTGIERTLVFALVVSIFLAGLWVVATIDDLIPAADRVWSTPQLESLSGRIVQTDAIIQKRREAVEARSSVARSVARAYETAREEYRTALDAGRADQRLRARYTQAKREASAAQAAVAAAAKPLSTAKAEALRLRNERQIVNERLQAEWDNARRSRAARLFGLHFGFAGAFLGLSYLAWREATRRRWRYISLLSSALTASVLLLGFLAVRCAWEIYLERFAWLAVSLMGISVSSLAIVGVKRYLLSPERVRRTRLSHRQCPTCVASFEPGQAHCWSCGTKLYDECPACGGERLRGTPHCSSCGVASK
jgi:hypothetical protein